MLIKVVQHPESSTRTRMTSRLASGTQSMKESQKAWALRVTAACDNALMHRIGPIVRFSPMEEKTLPLEEKTDGVPTCRQGA